MADRYWYPDGTPAAARLPHPDALPIIKPPSTPVEVTAARRVGQWAAALMVVLSSPGATYWMVGDQSSRVEPGVQLDYSMRPPDWSPSAIAATGIVSLIAFVIGAIHLAFEVRRHRLDGRWLLVNMILASIGFVWAGAYRVMTAGVIGANIGGGLAILFGPPVTVFLLAAAGVLTVKTIRDNRGRH
ncbi:MAG: hypothetical protein AB7V43_02830 [Acidimicrobiia bacterium]